MSRRDESDWDEPDILPQRYPGTATEADEAAEWKRTARELRDEFMAGMRDETRWEE